MATEAIKPIKPSRKDYLNLLREHNRKGLYYKKYKIFLWYQEHYGPISDQKTPLFNNHQKNG
jgi:hypothetical protein